MAGCDPSATSTTNNSTPSGTAATTTGAATLSWQAPTSNTNGTALTDLSGYKIYYGASATDLSQSVQISTVGIQTYVIDNLGSGTWYFAVKAVTSGGVESALSDLVSKTID
jgi:fibronectin type III domain protein